MSPNHRQRIAGHCTAASWQRLRLQRPGLIASASGPETVVDWLESAAPPAHADAATLLRSLSAGPWWMEPQQPSQRHVLTLHCGGVWMLFLRPFPTWHVLRIERPQRAAAALARCLAAMSPHSGHHP